MNIIDQLKADLLQSRKQRTDPIEKSLLTTVLGDAQTMSIDNNHQPVSDEDMLKLINKFIKNIQDIVDKYQEGQPSDTQARELDVLKRYKPTELTNDQLRTIILDTIQALNVLDIKQMGQVMGSLKKQYPSQFDGAVAAKMIKDILS